MNRSALRVAKPGNRLRLLAALAVLGLTFVAGGLIGRWATQEQAVYRLRQAIAEWRAPKNEAAMSLTGSWRPLDSHLHALDVAQVKLDGFEGRGGGLAQLDDGKIFYATAYGKFGLVDEAGKSQLLDFTIDMNKPALEQDPAFKWRTFVPYYFRVTDIAVVTQGGGRYKLYVGHHYFDAERRCIEMRLQTSVLEVDGQSMRLSAPFRRIMSTTPCITFFGPDYIRPFEGHFSGGRIVPMPDGSLLFSTGDHGWVGTLGYPALAQDMKSTLGKILRVDPRTDKVEIYARGVRNPQGLMRDSKGRIWETEQGPKGGDEVNLIVPGGDYGWPFSTFGTDYGPKPWSPNARQGAHEGGRPPVFTWTPAIGISQLIEYTGEEFPLWQGDLLVATLYPSSIYRGRLIGDTIVNWEQISFAGVDGARLRDIIQLKDGRIAMLTDSGSMMVVRNRDKLPGATPYLDPAAGEPLTSKMSRNEIDAALKAGDFYLSASTQPTLRGAAARGLDVHQRLCATCHAATSANGIGPSHLGIVGRRPGGVAGFSYSEDLAKGGPAWTAASAVEFAVNPQATHPGSTMVGVALTGAEKRDLAAYLATLK